MPQARRSGRTFRMLLQALMLASTTDNKDGVMVYAHDYRYARQLFDRAVDMMMSYSMMSDATSRVNELTITFPNDKMLIFKSIQENRERSMGINFRRYDELADHHVSDELETHSKMMMMYPKEYGYG